MAAGEEDEEHLVHDLVLADEDAAQLGLQPTNEIGARIEIERRRGLKKKPTNVEVSRPACVTPRRSLPFVRMTESVLTPALLAQVGDLDVVARTIVDGLARRAASQPVPRL